MTTVPNLDDPILNHLRTDFSPLRADQTVAEALTHLRENPPEGRVIYLYVVDDDQRLVGVVPTRRLLLSPAETKIADLMIRRLITIPARATVMDACELFTLHKLLAFPVVDPQGRLLGIVDIELYTDEVTDLAHKSNYDDLFQLIGFRAEQARMGTPLSAFKIRFPWLICNILGGILAAFLTGWYQGLLNQAIVLALFIPVVLALSESVGIQSVSLAIQSLHGGTVTPREVLRVLRRELSIGLLLGWASGLAVASTAYFWKGQGFVALCILTSIGTAVAASAVVGMAMPLAMRITRLDPRVAAGPIALVLADLITLSVYFNLGQWLLM